MFSYMERNADGAVVRLPKRDFDIHLMTFHLQCKDSAFSTKKFFIHSFQPKYLTKKLPSYQKRSRKRKKCEKRALDPHFH